MQMQDTEKSTQWVMIKVSDPETGDPRYLRKELPLNDAESLMNLIRDYTKEFELQFNRLYPQFEEKLISQKRTFEEKYHIVPTKDGFLGWFILVKMGMMKINEVYDEINQTWTFDYIDIPMYSEDCFSIEIVDTHLHQYCSEEKAKHDKIEKELTQSLLPPATATTTDDKPKKQKSISEISAKDAKIIAVYKDLIRFNCQKDVLGLMGTKDDLGTKGTSKSKTDSIRTILLKHNVIEKASKSVKLASK